MTLEDVKKELQELGIFSKISNNKLVITRNGLSKDLIEKFNLIEDFYEDEDGDDEKGRPIIRKIYSYSFKSKDMDQVKEDSQVIREFIANDESKGKALALANQIKSDFKNWFTINALIKKYKISTPEAEVRMRILGLFQLCIGREGNQKQVEFKIILTKFDRIKALKDRLDILSIESNLIENELRLLQEKK